MKLLVLSDLHLEFGQFVPSREPKVDAVILAGDIHSPGRKIFKWARRKDVFGPNIPIIVVPGNHEFYGTTYELELREMRQAASNTGVHLLDQDELILAASNCSSGHRVRFLGTTLWTDFRAPVLVDGAQNRNPGLALAEANRRLNDFRLINVQGAHTSTVIDSSAPTRAPRRLLRAEDTLVMHVQARDWLLRKFAEPFDGPTVVVTHHAPSLGSMAARYASDWLSPAFVSDLPAEFFSVPKLWVHGHTHTSFDYQIGQCRIVSNPRGYKLRHGGFENTVFNPELALDV